VSELDVTALSPEDDTIFAFTRNVVVAASAGTGKTHRLTALYVLLTLGLTSIGRKHRSEAAPPIGPESIVATTFSRAAAQEIADRIERALRGLASGETADPALSQVIAARCARLADGGGAPDLPEVQRRAAEALARWPSARIDTLHGVAAELVRAHALALGVPPGARVLEEDEAQALADLAVDEALSAALGGSDEQATAARELIAACSGVGGARREIARLLDRLDEDGLAPGQLALADHDAAVLEASRRLLHVARGCATAGSGSLREPAAALAAALSGWVDLRNRSPELRLPFPPAALAPVRQLIGARLPAQGRRTPADDALAELTDGLAGPTKSERAERFVALLDAGPDLALRERRLVDLLEDSRQRLVRARRRAGALSFGDLLRIARDGLARHRDVAAGARRGIAALLVDEFQDTSLVQRDLVYLLREREDAASIRAPGEVPHAGALERHGLFLVGDRKQSIYGFRGADVGVFARLSAELAGAAAIEALGLGGQGDLGAAEAPADFVALRESRRSGPALIAFVNAFASSDFAGGTAPVRDFEIAYGPAEHLVALALDDSAPRPRDEVVLVDDDGSPPDLDGGPIDPLLSEAQGPLREAFVAAAWVARELARSEGALRWGDVAVLARRRSTIPLVELALGRLGVPYVVAGRALYDASEVRDVAAALRLLLDPRDRLALATVLRGPMVGLSDAGLVALSTPGRGLAVPLLLPWPASDGPELGKRAAAAAIARLDRKDRTRLEAFRARFVELRRAALRLSPGDAIRTAIASFDLDRVLAALPRAEARIGNVDRLVDIARRRGGTLASFSRWLDRRIADEADEAEAAVFSPEDDAVRLTTIHASKGLDFPVVVLVDLNAAPLAATSGLGHLPESAERAATLVVRHVGRRLEAEPFEDAEAVPLTTPTLREARLEARAREHAERRRLTYVAMTRARSSLVLVGSAVRPRAGSAWAAISTCMSDPTIANRITRRDDARSLLAEAPRAEPPAPAPTTEPAPARPATSPARTLAIATTPLSVFRSCPRRFRLRHLLSLDEPVSSGQLDLFAEGAYPGDGADDRGDDTETADPRVLGRAAHRVLERWPREAWGAGTSARDVTRRLVDEGLSATSAETLRIADGIARFLSGSYARSIRPDAILKREEPFVLEVELPDAPPGPRCLALRGAMDLLVEHGDGRVDVIDYKRSRPRADLSPYEFQLRAYALAAHRRSRDSSVRAGVLFLGAADPTPLSGAAGDGAFSAAEHERFEDELRRLAHRFAEARWNESYDGVAVESCKALHCGFIVACHGRR